VDGRYLAIGYHLGAVMGLWVPEIARAWTWASTTEALLAATGCENIPASGPWSVELVNFGKLDAVFESAGRMH